MDHISENIYLGDLCREFGLSKNSIYQLFRDEFNSTVNEFIIKKRLELAETLLDRKYNMSITDTAVKCGFPDSNYFIRLF